MKTLLTLEEKSRRILRICALLIAFLALTVGAFFALRALHMPEGTLWQQGVYTLGSAMLLAGIATAGGAAWSRPDRVQPPLWACPLAAAGISLYVFCMIYAWLGVWPLGEKSVMMVDMHHQYAPLMSELRNMLLEGDSFTYSFHIGLGVNFIPTFAYYLSSPLNLLLVLFPERYLTEGILVITLIKNAAAAGAFAACAQYLYRRRNAAILAVSVLYSTMMYMLAYSWNIMWLDVVVLLPVVVLCMEHMLRTGKWLPYTLTLALALFANYYIGFMLCVFLVLYMAVWLLRQPRTGKQWLHSCGRFAIGSLLGGGLAAALLVPTALALGRTSAAGGGMPLFNSNFPLFALMGQFFYGAEPTIRSGNLPNLYCGIPAVLLLPLYFTQKHIPLRRRLCYGGLLAVMLLSCTINQWDMLWHGLHAPNDLPYRFSFLTSFVLLLLAGHVMTHLKQVTPKQILCSLAASALYLILWERFGGDSAPEASLVYGNLLLLAIYAAVLLAGTTRHVPRRATALLLLTVVCAELLIGGADTITKLNESEYYTNHDNYVDNDSTAANAAAIRRAQELAEAEGQVFTRMEYLPRSTCMDTALHHYNGITTFASSNPYRTTLFMGHLGYAVNGVNSYLYNSFVAAPDSLLGIRYVVLEARITSHAQLKLIDEVTVGSDTRYIYRNEMALPVGFYAEDDVLEYHGTQYDPFYSQQNLYTSLTGLEMPLYDVLELETDTVGATITGSSFYKPAEETSTIFTATVDEAGQYFAFVDCRAAESINVNCYSEDHTSLNSWGVTTYEPYIIDMGTMQPGQYTEVTIDSEGGVSGNIYIARLNRDVLQQYIDQLAAGGLQVTQQSATRLEGTITAAEDGVVFFSIPYDTGWTVTVDGAPVETLPVDATADSKDGALLAARIPAGQHTVTMSFRAPGQMLGLVISLISLLAVAAPFVWRRLRPHMARKTQKPLPMVTATEAAPETAEPDEEPVPQEAPADEDGE